MIDAISGASVRPTAPILHSFFENIIDKKVNKTALNIFESFVDFLCSYFYFSYQKRLTDRANELDINEQDDNFEANDTMQQNVATAEKIHYFMDGAPLYDRTCKQRIEVKPAQYFNILSGTTTLGEDRILIDQKPVFFSTNPNVKMFFGKQFNTQEVFVTDVKECPELVMIYERELNGRLKAWCVNTMQPTEKIVQSGLLPITRESIFIAETIASQPAPQPMVVPF